MDKDTALELLYYPAYRKGVRIGMGMRNYDSICEQLGTRFVEASENIEQLRHLFVQRAKESLNSLVRGLTFVFGRVKLYVILW